MAKITRTTEEEFDALWADIDACLKAIRIKGASIELNETGLTCCVGEVSCEIVISLELTYEPYVKSEDTVFKTMAVRVRVPFEENKSSDNELLVKQLSLTLKVAKAALKVEKKFKDVRLYYPV
jgi:hypothetical protein